MVIMPAVCTALLLGIVCFVGDVAGIGDKYHRFCYLDTAAQSRDGAGRFTVDDLSDVTLCTHLVFVSAVVDPVEADLAPAMQDDIHYYEMLTSLKKEHPGLKVLLLVGGPDTSNSALFSQVVNSTESIDLLTSNVLYYLQYHHFDGLEIDWRYPGRYGSIDDDTYRFSVLIRKLSETFVQEEENSGSERLMLNVRVTGDKDLLQKTVHVDEIARFADYIVVTAYDFYATESIIGHNSGLYGRKDDHQAFAVLNADSIVRMLTEISKLPSDQIVLGIPTYGLSTYFANDTRGFGMPHDGLGAAGRYTRTPGMLAYYEICLLISGGWKEGFSREQLSAFAFSDEEIVTYDDVVSVVNKANYIKENQLAGAALWDLSTDDFSGKFCQQGPFPLTSALKDTLTSPRTKCPPGEYGDLDTPGCQPCPLGTYQPSPNTTTCLTCPEGLTTLTLATTEPYHCVLLCASGSEYNPMTSSCDPCPLGYFRLEDVDSPMACLKCPPGFTTVATSSSDCVRKPDGVPEIEPSQIDVKATMTFVTTSCENKPVIVGAVRMLVKNYFTRLSRHWSGLCNDTNCNNVISDVTRGCDRKSGNVMSRAKRQAEEKLVVTIKVLNVSEEVNSGNTTIRTQSILATLLSERAEFMPLGVYGIYFASLDSLETTLVCETGSAINNGLCEPCGAGSVHNVTSGTCTPCPVGQFQPLAGQTSCTQCPGVMSTKIPGATSLDLCISPCLARPNYCYNDGVCHWTEADQGLVYCECPENYQGDRCATSTGVATSSTTGHVVGAVVGGVLALLIVILIVIAFCVCFRVRKAVKLRHVNGRSNSVQSNNHYMTWGTFSNAGARGVKFVDYIDYYMWLSNASDQHPSVQNSYRKPKAASQQSSSRHRATMTMTTMTADPQPPQPSTISYSNTNGTTGIAETNIDAGDKSDHDDHVY